MIDVTRRRGDRRAEQNRKWRSGALTICALLAAAAIAGCGGNHEQTDEQGVDSAAAPAAMSTATADRGTDAMLVDCEAALLRVDGAGDVTVISPERGVILLHGSVESSEVRSNAETVLQQVSGVRRVVNQVLVRSE